MKNFLSYFLLIFSFTNLNGQYDLDDYVLDSSSLIQINNITSINTTWKTYEYDSNWNVNEIQYSQRVHTTHYKGLFQEIDKYFYLDKEGKDSLQYVEISRDYNQANQLIKRKYSYRETADVSMELVEIDSLIYNQEGFITESYNFNLRGDNHHRSESITSYNANNLISHNSNFRYNLDSIEPKSSILTDYTYDGTELRFVIQERIADGFSHRIDSTSLYTTDDNIRKVEWKRYSAGFLVHYKITEDFIENDIRYETVEEGGFGPFFMTNIELTKTLVIENAFIPFEKSEIFDLSNGDTIKIREIRYSVIEHEDESIQVSRIFHRPNSSEFGQLLIIKSSFYLLKENYLEENYAKEYPEIKFYPNPVRAGETIFLEAQGSIGQKARIFNSQGQLVQETSIEQHTFINLKIELIPGMYYLIFEENGNRVSSPTPFLIID